MSGVMHGADTHWIVNSGCKIGTVNDAIMINDMINAMIPSFCFVILIPLVFLFCNDELLHTTLIIELKHQFP